MKTIGRILILGLLLLSPRTASAEPVIYRIDPVHSDIGFSVAHLTVSRVRGSFTRFEGIVAYDPQEPEATVVDVVIQADSIDTRVARRDAHLRGPDFLDTEAFPTIAFKSTKASPLGEKILLSGELTIRGVTRPFVIPVTISGPVIDPKGEAVIGLRGEATLDRREFRITWSKTLDRGGLMVGNEVTVTVAVEGHAPSTPQASTAEDGPIK